MVQDGRRPSDGPGPLRAHGPRPSIPNSGFRIEEEVLRSLGSRFSIAILPVGVRNPDSSSGIPDPDSPFVPVRPPHECPVKALKMSENSKGVWTIELELSSA